MGPRSEVFALAKHAGVILKVYSPGDGGTRYRFLCPATPEVERDYFAARSSYVLGTELGKKNAMTFLRGLIAGLAIREER